MNHLELTIELNSKFGPRNRWPRTYEVDAETYANCCQAVFNWLLQVENLEEYQYGYIKVYVGNSGGLMFKNVELLLKK